MRKKAVNAGASRNYVRKGAMLLHSVHLILIKPSEIDVIISVLQVRNPRLPRVLDVPTEEQMHQDCSNTVTVSFLAIRSKNSS